MHFIMNSIYTPYPWDQIIKWSIKSIMVCFIYIDIHIHTKVFLVNMIIVSSALTE